MKNKRKPIVSPYIQDSDTLVQASLSSLRTSFEIEGVVFSDEKFQALVDKVFSKKAVRPS